MTMSTTVKEDVVSTVLIELERMFTILSTRFPPELREQSLLVKKLEKSFKAALRSIDQTDAYPTH